MRRVLSLLWSNSEPISHWATVLAFAAAAIGSYYAYGQLKTASAQFEQANDQRRWQNYNEMNVRYAGLYENIPEEIVSGCVPDDFGKLKPDTKRWVRQYFNLYSEEYWLYKEKLIPEEMWTHRIHGGVRVNLSKYPALIDGYRYWKAAGAFTHPDDFHAVVDLAISDAKSPKYASHAPKPCKTPTSPSKTEEKSLHKVVARGG